MADMPGLAYGRVTGRFAAIVADSGDSGEYPDVLPMEGTVTFTPLVGPVKVLGSTPPTIIAPTPIVTTLDAAGDLSLNGVKGVYLVATNGPTSPTGWVYRVTFRLSLNGQIVDFPQLDIAVPSSSAQDIALLVPVSGGGNVTPQPITAPQQVFVGGTVAPTTSGPALWYKSNGSGGYELWVQEA
jgi:hypothetical protein